tara:strand:- start:355 stop:549 length:195 start_codon:yes stop_codon:yes gene_type:complete
LAPIAIKILEKRCLELPILIVIDCRKINIRGNGSVHKKRIGIFVKGIVDIELHVGRFLKSCAEL